MTYAPEADNPAISNDLKKIDAEAIANGDKK